MLPPRTMSRATQLLTKKINKNYYFHWISVLSLGTMLIFYFLLSEMGALVEIATVLSFITAPFYAILNYKLVTSKNMPDQHKPSRSLRILSIAGILFLTLLIATLESRNILFKFPFSIIFSMY